MTIAIGALCLLAPPTLLFAAAAAAARRWRQTPAAFASPLEERAIALEARAGRATDAMIDRWARAVLRRRLIAMGAVPVDAAAVAQSPRLRFLREGA